MRFITSVKPFLSDNRDTNLNGIVVPDTGLPGNKSDNPDFNAGFGGKFSYLQYQTSNNPGVNGIFVLISSDAQSGYGPDMAQGTGGDYRYLNTYNSSGSGIGKAALWRLDNSSGEKGLEEAIKAGYDGISGDFNRGRGGDYLYVVWKFSKN